MARGKWIQPVSTDSRGIEVAEQSARRTRHVEAVDIEAAELGARVTHHDKADKKRVAPALIGAVVIDTEVAELGCSQNPP